MQVTLKQYTGKKNITHLHLCSTCDQYVFINILLNVEKGAKLVENCLQHLGITNYKIIKIYY